MSNKLVRRAIETRLAAWAAARTPALRIAFEDVPFTPANGETYLEVFMLPAATGSDDLAGVHRVYRGVYQINVVTPSGVGPGPAEAIADELTALFPLNLRMAVGGFTAQVVTPATVAKGEPDPPTYTQPVSFQYRADTI
ncbi:phage tail terminator-like protein [Luteibacter sp. E-22]|uniref:phage tail terminator-like protein n=1 Tax=Luteibacter sp. E-22 TaxID=3404050 RepID=UPI003CEF0BB8